MGVRLRRLLLGGALLGSSGLIGFNACAQAVRSNNQLGTPTIPQAIEQAVSQGTYFRDQSLEGDARFLFGIDYNEAKLNQDAQRLEALYRDLQQQQAQDSPIIRTRDLANPYTASLLETQVERQELIIEPTP